MVNEMEFEAAAPSIYGRYTVWDRASQTPLKATLPSASIPSAGGISSGRRRRRRLPI